MNVCPKCNRTISDNLLDCPLCCNRKMREHLITYEADYIRDIKAGRVQLKFCRSRKSKVSHLEFIRIGGQAYCGEPLASTAARERVIYQLALEPYICVKCWQTLQGMIRTSL